MHVPAHPGELEGLGATPGLSRFQPRVQNFLGGPVPHSCRKHTVDWIGALDNVSRDLGIPAFPIRDVRPQGEAADSWAAVEASFA